MDKGTNIALSLLLGVTFVSGVILSSSYVSADDIIDNVAITVESSCSMSGNINTAHTANLKNSTYSGAEGSTYENGIGKTTLTTFCNDRNGFSIYAIGFTGNVAGNTNLVGASTGSTIPTGIATSGDDSNWAMKVTKVDNPGGQQPDVTYNPQNMTITNSFNNFHAVPAEYTKVAEYHAETSSSATDQGPGALGAKIETTYATYVSADQYADTYTGQVKYVMVHPYNTATPTMPPNPPTTCNTPVPGITYMQEINSTNRTAVLASLTEEAPYFLRDSRDEEPYCVSKLKDGKLWMLDNLRLDLTTANLSVLKGNTNASDQTLTYLKEGGGTSPYTATAVSYEESTSVYEAPRIAINGICGNKSITNGYCANDPEPNRWTKDSIPKNNNEETKYGAGSGKIGIYYNYCAASAGSYCYTSGSGIGNANEDICPTNWRMPTGGSNGEYNTLSNIYTNTTTTNTNSFQSKLSISLSGIFHDNHASNQGYYSVFWSSTYRDSDYMYDLDVYSSNIGPQGYWHREYGFTIRCVLSS